MCDHLMTLDKILWLSIKHGPFVPKRTVKVVETINPPKNKTDEETRKFSYDPKVENILIFVLSANLYYSISHRKTSQLMWNVLRYLMRARKI